MSEKLYFEDIELPKSGEIPTFKLVHSEKKRSLSDKSIDKIIDVWVGFKPLKILNADEATAYFAYEIDCDRAKKEGRRIPSIEEYFSEY